MSDIISQVITPQVRFVLVLILVFIALLYVLSIVWVIRDSYLRGASPTVWGIVALVPFIGCMVYAMMRPPLYASDREEQNIGLLLQQRELMDYGECPQCGYPTIRDYVLCPNCHTRLRNQCGVCGHTLEQEWSICPYCGTRAEDSQRQAPRRMNNVVERRMPEPRDARQMQAETRQRMRSVSSPNNGNEHVAGAGQLSPRPNHTVHHVGSSAPSESGRIPRVAAAQRKPSSSNATAGKKPPVKTAASKKQTATKPATAHKKTTSASSNSRKKAPSSGTSSAAKKTSASQSSAKKTSHKPSSSSSK